MKTISKNRKIAAVLVAFAAIAGVAPAHATDAVYRLCRVGNLGASSDGVGITSHSNGNVYLNGYYVGQYIKRVRSATNTSGLNKGAVELWVHWYYGDHNFTVQGGHDYSSGKESGSVSAQSPGFAAFNDAKFSLVADGGSCWKLTITY